jgi:DNA-directed RNA polymerase subunit RPC12/RpoP
MQTPQFIENNEGFICVKCGREVPPHPSSSRDHCHHCLTSLHVDVNPGDRMNECGGILEPIGLQAKSGKTQIVYRCRNCHAQVFNLVAPDDNAELIAELSAMPW